MPSITKKSYQYLNLVFIFIVSSLYPILTHASEANQDIVFYGVGFITMAIMSILLIFIEYKLAIKNKISITLYILMGLVFPPLLFLYKYLYAIILIIFVPIMIYNISKQRKTNYRFKVDNYYLINLIYLVSLILGVMMILTKEPYYLIGIAFIILTIIIDSMILYNLYKVKSKTIVRRTYLTVIILSLTFFMSFMGELSINNLATSHVTINLIYPILAIIFLSLSSRLNRSNLINLVDITSIK